MTSIIVWNARIHELPDHLAIVDGADRAIADRLSDDVLPGFLIKKREQR